MAPIFITPPEKRETPKPQTDWLKVFKDWADEKFGFTLVELVDIFAGINNLTPEEIETLTGLLKREGWKPEPQPLPTEKPPTPEKPPTEKPPTPEKPPTEKPPGRPSKPKPPRPRGEILQAFLTWIKGKTGFQLGQLLGLFAYYYKLTGLEYQNLREDVSKLPPEKLPPEKKPPEKKPPEEKPPKQPTVKPDLIIGRTPYPKWWKDSLNAKIDLTAPGSQMLATVSGKSRLYVSVIVITVTAETVITFTFGNAGSSGPIFLGGSDQPMGMVVAMGNSPAPCGNGNLVISATDPTASTPSVGGWATCFAVEEKEMKG